MIIVTNKLPFISYLNKDYQNLNHAQETTTSIHFNSIKVQLKPSEFTSANGSPTIFQFHKGTIKTIRRFTRIFIAMSKFQFHKGTIKTQKIYADFYRNDQISIP